MEPSSGGWLFSEVSTIERNSTLLSSQAHRLMLEILILIMSLAAIVGNILVIVIVAATKTFHSVTSILIINLAISDFLVGIGVMPFVAVSIMNVTWVNCKHLCLYVGFTSSVFCTVSVLTIAAIALDRYFSIVDCLRYNSRCTICRTCLAVLWIWLQALLTSSPPLFGWSNISFIAPVYSCTIKWGKSPSYTVLMTSVSFLLPAVMILFCYVKIIRVARYHARRIHSLEEHLQRSRSNLNLSFMDSNTPSKLVYHVSGRFVMDHVDLSSDLCQDAQSEASSRSVVGRFHSFWTQIQPQNPTQPQHHGVLRLVLVIGAFFLCWTPYISVALVQATESILSRPDSLVSPSVLTFSYWLVLFNSDINPLLYALLSKRFQGALQSLRWKVRARLASCFGREGAEGHRNGNRGESDPTNGTTHSSTMNSRNESSSVFSISSSSWKEQVKVDRPVASSHRVCADCCGPGFRTVEHLQVPSKQRERNKLPYSAATQKKQATFFYGQIMVRVEHDIC